MMDLCNLLFIFLLMKLSGTQDVTTVRKISVQKGKSITIPCLYRQEYTNSYKYLRAGYNWLFSKYIESSDHQCNHSTVCISDDTSHNIFTVHMNNIQESGNFWCAVRIPYGWDKRTGFFLEVTEGPPRLQLDNQSFEDGTVTIRFSHRGSTQGNIQWCKLGEHCMEEKYGTLNGASVLIRNDQEYIIVTMSNLKKENTGWYWCSVGDLQMPVHITLKQKNTRSTLSTTTPPTIVTNSIRTRTAILFLLPVIIEVVLLMIIYGAFKLFKLYRERRLKSTNQAAGESHYVIMNRKRSSHSHGCAATVEGAYEHMDGLKRNTESHGCAATVEGAYEHMDGLKRNTESHCCATGERTYKDTVGLERNIKLPASGNKFTCPSVVKNSDL
ncbi:uncharacterized protein si:ch1073-59l16.1 isoform X4 [Xyrauchen texanus]|uniref:uncharacterized protein si:ch1073-59l16.1 isoform X2 n=1 Tax=Xyrauchen texanus TaxID=154827 RepID=UPI002242089E|nr:uncharacterized protein si:ch1073-59l16.1 isoform X2 [Xyrauchen texanus]XP_051969384.1 uncharacterized protein si:ch1073-59l16.1 isoform X3 [Xyrauchen texanus]XP_051969385.1 uncharacterized protein si:ch1073-59l16.1 isoform X4 [Xyrauchen texanus]